MQAVRDLPFGGAGREDRVLPCVRDFAQARASLVQLLAELLNLLVSSSGFLVV